MTGFRSHRLRRTPGLRRLATETRLHAANLIEPRFVKHGSSERVPVASMPGVVQNTQDTLVEDLAETVRLGIGAVLLFGVPLKKDAEGSEAYDENGIVPRAIRAVKTKFPDLVVIADVCLCEYTDHGHCGLMKNHALDNDASLPFHTRAAVAYARAGAEIVAPSSMLDGVVGAIRSGLDAAGHHETAILAYSAKHASSLYGPFREAAHAAPSFGDRKTYQMNPANAREALREIRQDLAEGADAVMVKPGITNLDLLARLRHETDVPLAAYQVSGEYASLRAAAEKGWLDYDAALLEYLVAMRRAGADWIVTYGARDAVRAL